MPDVASRSRSDTGDQTGENGITIPKRSAKCSDMYHSETEKQERKMMADDRKALSFGVKSMGNSLATGDARDFTASLSSVPEPSSLALAFASSRFACARRTGPPG